MAEIDVSTLSLQSNVYPVVNEVPYHDKAFISAIHDPELLQVFNNGFEGRYHLSPLQDEERKYAISCRFAESGDFPWGTIPTDAGERVVCKCENYGCSLFAECRPGVEAPEAKEHGEALCITPLTETLPDEESIIPDMKAFNEAFYGNLEITPQKIEESQEGVTKDSCSGIDLEQDANNSGFDFDFDFDFDFYGSFLESETEQEATHDEDSSIPTLKEVNEGPSCDDPELTEEQLRVVALPADARAVVNAGPGTGKTFTLIEKIKYMLENQGVPSGNILVLCFSRAAVNVIEDRLSAAVDDGQLTVPWQSLDIRTFDKFATWILYSGAAMEPSSVPEPFLPDPEKISRLNYDQRILASKNLIANWHGLFDNVSHVFIDETQDLVSPRSDLVLAILARQLPWHPVSRMLPRQPPQCPGDCRRQTRRTPAPCRRIRTHRTRCTAARSPPDGAIRRKKARRMHMNPCTSRTLARTPGTDRVAQPPRRSSAHMDRTPPARRWHKPPGTCRKNRNSRDESSASACEPAESRRPRLPRKPRPWGTRCGNGRTSSTPHAKPPHPARPVGAADAHRQQTPHPRRPQQRTQPLPPQAPQTPGASPPRRLQRFRRSRSRQLPLSPAHPPTQHRVRPAARNQASSPSSLSESPIHALRISASSPSSPNSAAMPSSTSRSRAT